jgi:hypothetical protein
LTMKKSRTTMKVPARTTGRAVQGVVLALMTSRTVAAGRRRVDDLAGHGARSRRLVA